MLFDKEGEIKSLEKQHKCENRIVQTASREY